MISKTVFLLAAVLSTVHANSPMLLSQEGRYQNYGGRPGAELSLGRGPSSHSLHHLSPSASEDSSFGHSHDFHHLPKAQHHLEPRPFRRPLDADDSHFIERHMPKSSQFEEEAPEGYSSQSHEAMNHAGGDEIPEDHYLHHPSEHQPHRFSVEHDQGHFHPGPEGSFEESHHHHQSHQPRFEESRYSDPESDFQSDRHESPLVRDDGEYHMQGPSNRFNYDEGGQLLGEEFNAKHGGGPSPWMSGQLMSSQPGGEFGLPSGTGVNVGVAPLDAATIGARRRELGIHPPRMGRAIPNEAFRKFRPMTMPLRPRGHPPMAGLSHSEPMSFQSHLNAVSPPRSARLNFAPMGGHQPHHEMSHSMGGGPMGHPRSMSQFDAPKIEFASATPTRVSYRTEVTPHGNFDDIKSAGAFSEMMAGGGPHGGPYFGGNAWKK